MFPPIIPAGPTDGGLLQSAQTAAEPLTRLGLFHSYMVVFIAAFLITLLTTPLLRKLAIANGVIDHPNDPRKAHAIPVAYLGGVAVYLGILAGVLAGFLLHNKLAFVASHTYPQHPLPLSLLLGMTLIMAAGLIDDVVGLSPRIKISMQLIAAAAIAMEDVGVKVAAGIMKPIGKFFGNEPLFFQWDITLPAFITDAASFMPHAIPLHFDLIYWTGTAIIAIFILGATNASNLIDGLDGLCTGVTSIAAAGLLMIALTLAVQNDGQLDSARIILSLCLLGATLGFLPHNFKPATIFLGDCGSMLLGFMTIAIILTLGDTGRTQLVVAGLIIYSVPIIDTVLAIVRRKMAGKSMSDADDQHLHHMLKRSLGVQGAVFTLYGIAAVFAVLGASLSLGRARVAYVIALVLASYIGVTAVKAARWKQLQQQALGAQSNRFSAHTLPTPTPAQRPTTQPEPVTTTPEKPHEPRPV